MECLEPFFILVVLVVLLFLLSVTSSTSAMLGLVSTSFLSRCSRLFSKRRGLSIPEGNRCDLHHLFNRRKSSTLCLGGEPENTPVQRGRKHVQIRLRQARPESQPFGFPSCVAGDRFLNLSELQLSSSDKWS